MGSLGLAASGGLFVAYRADSAVIREIADGIAANSASPADRVIATTHWVFDRGRFQKNEGYFGWKRLGPTPLQVVENGGDCADRSRLVVAILREMGIRSTQVMLFDPAKRAAVHTVVEATLPSGERMVVDPAFNLYFPDGRGGYFGLADLRNDPTILPSRLDSLIASRGYWTRVNGYRRERSVYSLASTFNWERNALTRSLGVIVSLVSYDATWRLYRPAVLEEPKLALAAVAAMSGVFAVCTSVLIKFFAARRAESAKRLRRSDGLARGIDADGSVQPA